MGLYEAMCVNSSAYKLSSGPVLTSIEIGFHCHYQGFLPVKSYRPLEMDHVHNKKTGAQAHTQFAMTKCKASHLSHLAHGM